MHSPRFRNFLYLIGVSFLIASLAFMNRYPFVDSDTGSYVRSAFTLDPLVDRPIGYGLIIRAVSWKSTLWTVVMFQSFIIGWLLYEVLKELLPARTMIWRVHLVLIAALIPLSSMPWLSAEIMPDAFTGAIGLIYYLLFFGRRIGLVRKGFLWVCLIFFLMAHYSHVAISVILLGGMALLWLLGKGRSTWPGFWRTWTGACAAITLCIAFVVQYNAWHGLRPVFSPSSNVFLAGRLCQSDVLGAFLREHCDERHYPICPYKDELPIYAGDFIWPEKSVLNRMQLRMEVADTVLAPMVRDLFTEPKFLGRYLKTVLIGTVMQLFQVNTGSTIVSFDRDSSPYFNIQKYLRWEADIYMSSYQAHNGWNMEFINKAHHLVLLLSVIFMALAWPQGSAQRPTREFLVLMLIWVFLNAAVTASLATPYDRFGARVSWLVVLGAALLLLRTPWLERVMAGQNEAHA